MNIETIFVTAAQKPVAERNRYLDDACGGDSDLRRKVERLLKAHDAAANFLEPPPQRSLGTVDYTPLSEQLGTRIGPYVLLEQIGEGGFGLVFVAEQQEPVKRRVALKIIKPGMDSAQIIARFEAERQALALMDHPNIAKVLDAGATEAGRPYFVMELVRGIPITEYCDQNQLTPRDRLELFVTVCQAIQHAHQKGIIHRDIKPSNVLVTSHDGKPVAKVIDFGVAKAIHHHLTERTIYTNFAQMIGTPLYMSPEQAEMSGLDIDTRSDVYSLGVLLYELLTGTTPLEKKRFREAAYDEIRRLIREEEPPKPSTRLSQSAEALPSVAAQRKMEPTKLSRFVRGDLDWITMKALEKDRTRRYDTAIGLARDVERYLGDEPVDACPPSAIYRFRKFAKKNRTALTSATVIVFLLLLGTGVSIWQAVRATAAERQARRERDAAEEQRQAAEAAQQRARQAAATSQAVNRFLVNDVLAEASPTKNARGRALTVEEALGKAAKRVAMALASQPDIESGVRLTIGKTYNYLGLPREAEPHLRRALQLRQQLHGDDDQVGLEAAAHLGLVLYGQGKPVEAETLLRKSFAICQRALGAHDRTTLETQTYLALVVYHQGKIDEGEQLDRSCLENCRRFLGSNDDITIIALNDLANMLYDRGKTSEAEPLLRECLDLSRRTLGPEHPGTLTMMGGLAERLHAQGKSDEAETMLREVVRARRYVQGSEHRRTLSEINILAELLQSRGKLTEAESLYRESLSTRRKIMPPDSWRTAETESALGGCLLAQGRYAEAEPLLVQGYARMKAVENTMVVQAKKRTFPAAIERLVRLYESVGKPDEAVKWKRELAAFHSPAKP